MKKLSLFFLTFILIIFTGAFSACSSIFSASSADDPFATIKAAYGTTPYKISFNSENLTEPIDDITYSAYEMPTLPTPKRVGYVFDGWYFDSDYLTPYYENVLYLYMCDVTLYAKWAKEVIVQDGVYDIDVSLAVTEGSVVKSSLADKYGNSTDYFLADVDVENMQIEKSDDKILLKFPYSIRASGSFGGNEMYYITVNSKKMGSSVRIAEQIAASTETARTIYFDITNIALEDTIYLNVNAYKWDAEVEEEENVDNTRISFTLEVTITEFYGFTTSFADPDVKLEDGVYSVKTYYDTNMMSSFNSVFSYLYANDGHYTLVKPFMPYTGYVGTGFNLDYYYNISTVMLPIQYYYGISAESGAVGTYKPLEIEYHADTGRYYYVFDLGTELKQDLLFTYVVGGPMQTMFHSGAFEMTLNLKYDAMIKISDAEYTPLGGDCYQYQDTFTAAVSDDMTIGEYEYISDYGASASFINFYFSAGDITDPKRTMYSHKMTIAPTDDITSAADLNNITFRRSVHIYGYDVTRGESLFANLFENQSLGEIALWGNEQIKSGISLSVGDNVDLESIFYEKVSADADFSDVDVSAYYMSGNSVNFSSVCALSANTFIFDGKSVAVMYRYDEYDEGGGFAGTRTAVVELHAYVAPTLQFNDDFAFIPTETVSEDFAIHLYAKQTYGFGDTVYYPSLYYLWYGYGSNFIGTYTSDDFSEIHPIYVATYYLNGEEYFYEDFQNPNDLRTFKMSEDHIVIVYELHNPYGERYYVHIHFSTGEQEGYVITRNGENIASGRVTYSDGIAKVIAYKETYSGILTDYNALSAVLRNEYVFTKGEASDVMALSEATVYKQSLKETITEDAVSSVLAAVANEDYAIIELKYTVGQDSYTVRYAYKMRFNGETTYTALPYDTVFTGKNYTLSIPQITSESGLALGSGTIRVLYNGSASTTAYKLTKNDASYTVLFLKTGQFDISYYVSFNYAGDGKRVFNRDGNLVSGGYITVCQTVNVEDGQGTVTVTYVADENHPFISGSADGTFTETYRLTDAIYLLSGNNFVSENGATLLGWATDKSYGVSDYSRLATPGAAVSDFISAFNSKNVTLYAVWDEKVTVTLSLVSVTGGEETIVGEDVKTVVISAGNGHYFFRISALYAYAYDRVPNGYQLAGFKGGFLGDEVVPLASDAYFSLYDTGASYRISAVYAKIHTVSYDTGYRTYSGTFYGNEKVVEGSAVSSEKTVEPYPGYRFIGWYVQGDETKTIVEMETYIITGDVTFVALFETIEEEDGA